MPEHLKRQYAKEEEFLDAFAMEAEAVYQLLGGDWKPDYWCNDKTRLRTKLSLSRGELHALTFDSAFIYCDKKGFSSAHVTLKSSRRVVTVRVKRTDGDLIAEKIVDRSPQEN